MTELNPEIWDNPTLGAAAPNENLDRLTKQQLEDAAAKAENREPREIVNDNTYPDWKPEVEGRTGTVPSNYQTVHFADEQPADVQTDSGHPESDAGSVSEPDAETNSDSQVSPDESQVSAVGGPPSNETSSHEEGNTSQWA